MPMILVALALAGALVLPAAASAAPAPPYRTDHQAERHLERTRGGSASCINGYYSRHEQRTGRHFPQRSDERFASFACTSTTAAGTRRLYLQTRPRGRWVVLPDR